MMLHQHRTNDKGDETSLGLPSNRVTGDIRCWLPPMSKSMLQQMHLWEHGQLRQSSGKTKGKSNNLIEMVSVSTSSSRILPVPKFNFKLRPDGILALTRLVLEQSVKELDRVGSIFQAPCTISNVILPLAQVENRVSTELSPVSFLQFVSADESVRSASAESQKLIDVHSPVP